MVSRSLFVVFLLSVSLAYGQLDSNTITVTATRASTLQPDQVVFSVSVFSGVSTTFEDVLNAVSSAGITRASFTGIGSGVSPIILDPSIGTQLRPTIAWNFTVPVPFSKMKDEVTALTALQKTITQNNSGLTLSFTVQGTQISPQLQQSQTCSASDLLADARAEAQTLANAANLFLGSVLSMSSITLPITPIPNVLSTPSCSLTVKFAVTR